MFGFPFETITNATRRQTAMDRVFDFFGLRRPRRPSTSRLASMARTPIRRPADPGGRRHGDVHVRRDQHRERSAEQRCRDRRQRHAGQRGRRFHAHIHRRRHQRQQPARCGRNLDLQRHAHGVAGQYTNIGTVTGQGNAQAVMDTDPANYFGAAPGIRYRNARQRPGRRFADGSDPRCRRHRDVHLRRDQHRQHRLEQRRRRWTTTARPATRPTTSHPPSPAATRTATTCSIWAKPGPTAPCTS